MRIALCFSGQPRSYKAGFDYYEKNLFQIPGVTVDIFIHTWDTKGMEWYDLIKLYEDAAKKYGGGIRTKVDNPLRGDYNKKYTNTPNGEKWPPFNTVSAFYSTFQVMVLKAEMEQKYSQYDWVIKTRTDFALPVQLPYERMDKNMIYMPNCRKVYGDWLGNDQFAIGSSYNMNKYMSTWLNLETFYNRDVQMIGEDMLRAQLVESGLRMQIGYIDMPKPFPPGPHNGTPHFLIRDDLEKWQKQ